MYIVGRTVARWEDGFGVLLCIIIIFYARYKHNIMYQEIVIMFMLMILWCEFGCNIRLIT